MNLKEAKIIVEEIKDLHYKRNVFENFFIHSFINLEKKPSDKQASALIKLYERASGCRDHEQSQII